MTRTVIGVSRTLAGARTSINSISRNNLVYNGDFEIAPSFTAATSTASRWINGTATGSNGNSSQHGWSLFTNVGTSTSKFDSSIFHSGSQSMELSTTATGSQCVVSNNKTAGTIKFGGIKLVSSTLYNVSFWMKTNLVSGSAVTGARLAVDERTPAGSFVGNNFSTGILTTTDWTQYSFTYTSTSATSNFLDIQPTVTGNNGTATLIMDAWFDDIIITIPISRPLA